MSSGEGQQQQLASEIGHAVRYLDALEIFTKGDFEQVKSIIPQWMASYNRGEATTTGQRDATLAHSTPLHLAVQCAKKDLISQVLAFDSPRVPIDAPDAHGMTALHLAAKAARKDIVKLLLRHGADDMLLDSSGQDALAYATEADVAAVIQDHRSEGIRAATANLFSLVRSGAHSEVKAVLENAAESGRINLAARDSDGGTLLHAAVQNGDVELAKWAITQGVDVFAVDASGAMADKYAEGQPMKELLGQAPMGNARTALSGKAPKLSGQLHKWTNYASGWKQRWFELEAGVLSYYKDKADADASCRGAINLRIARIIMGKDRTQFEVHGKGSIKYRLKARDAALAKQWVHLLNLSKQWALENHKQTDGSEPEKELGLNRPHRGSVSTVSVSVHDGHARGGSVSSAHDASGASYASGSPATRERSGSQSQLPDRGMSASPVSSIMSSESDDELYIARDDFTAALSEVKAQLFIQTQLLDNLATQDEVQKYKEVAARSAVQLGALVGTMESAYKACNAAWQVKMRKEQERIDMLADSLRTAVVNSNNLIDTIRTKGQTPSVPVTPVRTDHAKGADEPEPMAAGGQSEQAGVAVLNLDARDICSANFASDIVEPLDEDEDEDDDSDFADATDEFFDTVTSVVTMSSVPSTSEPPEGVVDAVEQAAAEEAAPEADKELPAPEEPAHKDLTDLSGYSLPVRIRKELPDIKKGGPSLNLWSIIKGAIGKDLSKISVPVFFNEPSSFLQRFTEDMEYCDLLEIATLLPRSEDRTLFVAGFAMSNYASTFGRIAKPFNPLLGETFEYVRRDKKYRAISEQVEHHPPISACWVEGKNYTYHADTNIRSKFNGGSLTVIPTGVCHVTLNLPLAFLERDEETSAGKPKQAPQVNEAEGYFVEHYTWDKLTTNVNGIMIANFWIEHFGDLDVKNHRTGDMTKITFLQSNWMGKNKFKVTGEARNRRGAVVHEIGGDWTSKLVAKPVGHSGDAASAEDIKRPQNMDATDNVSDAVQYAATNTVELPKRPFVLWKVNPRKEERNSYHLTTFAMSLNDKPAELEPYLCPTDSRFRPDQRAMETGEYEMADREKSRLENKQRATRRRREQGELAQWKPRWFVKDVDSDSGESFWRFNDEYWTEREVAAKKQKEAGATASAAADVWNGVEDIF